jgi:hypothetical protein
LAGLSCSLKCVFSVPRVVREKAAASEARQGKALAPANSQVCTFFRSHFHDLLTKLARLVFLYEHAFALICWRYKEPACCTAAEASAARGTSDHTAASSRPLCASYLCVMLLLLLQRWPLACSRSALESQFI